MTDIELVIVGVLLSALLAITAYAAYEYYKQLRKVQKEYVRARDSVEDIILSFTRELRREAEKLEVINFEAEGASSKANAGLKKAESIEERLIPFEEQISQIGIQFADLNNSMTLITETNSKTLEKLSGISTNTSNEKIDNIESVQEFLKKKIIDLEEQMQKVFVGPENAITTSLPVIPIKRDKALAALTDTEISVLEFLSSEGPKTAPEIKEKVQLSREHTSRLMKKLYEEGYLERETGKLPFKYSVKKEMEKLLKKPETSVS